MEITSGFGLWWSKHIIGFNGIGIKTKQMVQWDNDKCKVCNKSKEHSTTHIFECPAHTMIIKRVELYQQLIDWLKGNNVDPIINK